MIASYYLDTHLQKRLHWSFMRFTTFLLSLLIACESSDEGLKIHNSNPQISIISHSTGESFLGGYELIFQATVSDGNHDAEELTVTWVTDQRTLCSASLADIDGTSSCQTSLQEEIHKSEHKSQIPMVPLDWPLSKLMWNQLMPQP